jgi:heat shock protein HspQ
MQLSNFFIGQIVDHNKAGYRGVIFGVDAEFSLSEEWYEEVARSRPPKDKPWYHVMVDGGSHTTYVAERHLAASRNHSQIEHPGLGSAFNRFDGTRYFSTDTMH